MALKWRDLWALYCPELDRDELDRCTWLQGIPARWPAEDTTPVDVCDWLAELYGTWADEPHRKKWGQYFTPPTIARFMAELADPLTSDEQVLEPGAGLGILIAALAERIVKKHTCSQWAVVAYESDETLRPALALALGYTRRWLNTWNVQLTFEIRADDFILANMSILRPAPLFEINAVQNDVDLIIANPPYFKLPKDDPRVAIMSEVVNGQPNIYALFMAASAKMLQPDGQLVFITPRSFCSGSYFRQFRNWFFRHVRFERVHGF